MLARAPQTTMMNVWVRDSWQRKTSICKKLPEARSGSGGYAMCFSWAKVAKMALAMICLVAYAIASVSPIARLANPIRVLSEAVPLLSSIHHRYRQVRCFTKSHFEIPRPDLVDRPSRC
jgi:hypothetical protein